MIEIKNLTKRFEKTVAINNLNCEISEGMIFGLAGSNGSGKSTLLRTLSGVYEPNQGQVIIDGQNAFDNHVIKERCAYIADYPYLMIVQLIKWQTCTEECIQTGARNVI